MKGKLIRSIFWALIAVFILLAGVIFVPALNQQSAKFAPFGLISLGVAFFLLGGTLIFLVLKEKPGGRHGKFLLLTGASAAGLPVFVLLHNIVSGLFNAEEPVFFIMAIFICPLGFLVGAAGSIVLAIKNRQVKAFQ
jgi:hypothetical protein